MLGKVDMSEGADVIATRTKFDLEQGIDPGPRPGSGLWRRLNANSLVRHNALLLISGLSASALTFLFHPIVGHLLGSDQYGTVVSFGSLSMILSLPAAIVPNLFNKFTADLVAHGRIDQVRYLLRRGTKYAIMFGVVAAVLFAVLGPSLAHAYKVPLLYVLLNSLGFVLAFAVPLSLGAVQGRQQFAWFSLVNFLSAFLRVALTAVALLLGWGLIGTFVAGFATGLIVYGLTFLPLRDIFRGPETRVPSLRPLLNYSLGATLAFVAGTLLSNTDTTLAAPFLTHRDASYYDAVATMGRIVLFVAGSFVTVMFPKVATLHQQGRPHGAVLAWTMAGVCTLSLCVIAVFAVAPDKIVGVIFQHQQAPPLAVTRLVVWYGVAMLCLEGTSVLTGYFMALGRLSFVPIAFAAWALEVVLFMHWHSTIAQMVTVTVITMAAEFAALAIFYAATRAFAARTPLAGGAA